MAQHEYTEGTTARVRQVSYLAGTAILAIVGVLQIVTGLSAENAELIGGYVTGILTLLGSAAPAVAGLKVGSQINRGVL